MLILDTDTLSLLQIGRGADYERIKQRLAIVGSSEEIFVTIVSFEEQSRGWLAQIAAARTAEAQVKAYARLLELLRDYSARRILPMDNISMEVFRGLKKAKVRIGTMDLKIAAIVQANRATLISRNLKDFRRVPGLNVEDWTAPE